MARRVIRAKDVQPGDVMAPSLEAETFSVREVWKTQNPVFKFTEVTIVGPLGVKIKRHIGDYVTILV